MNDKPILFSCSMVRSILDGRKTMTRRVVKDQHLVVGAPRSFEAYSLDDCECGGFGFASEDDVWKSPYGQPGDLLWVRETALFWRNDSGPCKVAAYAADGYQLETGERWTPSIHMPRWASRLTLKVTGVRVERLQDISCHDALNEGCERCVGLSVCGGGCHECYADKPVVWFRDLWDSINGKPRANGQDISWDANPWVWVVSFEPIHMNIDQRLESNGEAA